MSEALVVDLNRSTHHAIEPASESFETTGPFVVRVQNHGEGSHVHCSLSGDLASTATVTDGNPFLEPEEVVEIPIDVRTDLRPARGTLELSTGYGRESVEIDVLVRESSNVPTSPIEPERTGASETSSPSAAPDGDAPTKAESATAISLNVVTERLRAAAPRRDLDTALLLGVSLLALLVGVGASQLFDSAVVLFAVLVVLATVVGAIAVVLRQ